MCGFVVYAEYNDCDPLSDPDNPIQKDQVSAPMNCAVHWRIVCIHVSHALMYRVFDVIATTTPVSQLSANGKYFPTGKVLFVEKYRKKKY